MPDAAARYRPRPNVVSTLLEDGERVLLDLTTMRTYTVNPTGALVWTALGEGLAIPATAQRLAERFEITPEDAEAYVASFLADLAGRGLVEEIRDRPAP